MCIKCVVVSKSIFFLFFFKCWYFLQIDSPTVHYCQCFAMWRWWRHVIHWTRGCNENERTRCHAAVGCSTGYLRQIVGTRVLLTVQNLVVGLTTVISHTHLLLTYSACAYLQCQGCPLEDLLELWKLMDRCQCHWYFQGNRSPVTEDPYFCLPPKSKSKVLAHILPLT